VKNPGSVRLDFKEFTYEIHFALSSDDFERRLGETGTEKESEFSMDKLRVLFGKRSWFEGYEYIFLEPGERSQFSFVASLPAEATMVALHCEFIDKNEHVETVRKCYAVLTTSP